MSAIRLNPNVLSSQIAKVSILYFLLWVTYFVIFHDIRLMRGWNSDQWYYALIMLPTWMVAMVVYGLVIPLICAIVFGAITSRERPLRVFISLLLVAAIFSAISSGFEIVFEHRPVALWRFYLFSIPPLCVFGEFAGRLLGKFATKSN